MKKASLDIVRVISEFTFLFWLDNIENINEKRIEFEEIFQEQIENLNEELKTYGILNTTQHISTKS